MKRQCKWHVQQLCRLFFLCHVHLLTCWTLWVTFICCVGWTETLSCALSVELSHVHLLSRLNWVTFIYCLGWIESLSCALSVALSHPHLLCRLNWDPLVCSIGCFKSPSSAVSVELRPSHVLYRLLKSPSSAVSVALFASRHLLYKLHCQSLADSTLSVALIVLYRFCFLCHVHCTPSFSVTFDTTHPTCNYLNSFNFFYPNLF